jgi:hypothetical protein
MIIGHHGEVELPPLVRGVTALDHGAKRINETMVGCHEGGETFDVMCVDRRDELLCCFLWSHECEDQSIGA